jgi:predicted ester cyclase
MFTKARTKSTRVVRLAALALSLSMTLSAHAQTPLTVEQGRAIVAPVYDALTEPTKKDVDALLAQATTADFQSCSTNTECVGRDAVAKRFKATGAAIPDLRWTIKDIWVSGDHVFVRGQATGTPIRPFLGVAPTGKSFDTMSIDAYAVKDGKIERSYHVENWTAALRQLGEK